MFQRSLNSMPTDAGHGIRPLPSSGAQSDWGERALQRTWRSLGGLWVLIGLVTAFVPVLPTTVFLLIGAWAYGKGDPALRERLLNHPRFGGGLRLWADKRQITRRGKVAAIAGISVSGAITAATLGSRPLSWGIGAGLLGLCAYLATRAEPSPSH